MTAASSVLVDRLAPPSMAGSRAERGRAWLEEHGLPSTRDEAWRYTPVAEIIQALSLAVRPAPASAEIDGRMVDELAGRHGGPRLVFVNGIAVPTLAGDEDHQLPDGLVIANRDGMRTRSRMPRLAPDQPADGFHALNWAAGSDVAAVVVEPGVRIDRPVHVVHVAVPGDVLAASHPRTVLLAKPGSHVHLIESFVAVDGSPLTNASTRIVAGEGASATYHRIQAETPTAIHVGRTAIEQAAGSRVRATSVMTGGHIARSAVDVRLAGDDARIDIDGLCLPRAHQRHDHVVTVDHLASRGTSTQSFRAIVDDHARASFSGHVIVRPGTTGTEAHQSNRNLVLRPTAEADSRPWLEILADDVRCTHGATVGRLDDEALFYLRSRGIPLAEARAVLVAAFAAEVTDGLTPASLRRHVDAATGRTEGS